MTLSRLVPLWIVLWITPSCAFAWGELGHRIVAEYGAQLADPASLAGCRVTKQQLIDHTNDPDKIWRQQRLKHMNEAEMHFFHVDRQPDDWRKRDEAKDKTQGRLVYRLASWIEEAKKLRKNGKWDDLAEHLYGISHYLGDLSQPLHLHHDYDGEKAGVPGLHSQWETKMLNRYENEIRAGVKARLGTEKVPALWQGLELRNIVFDTAVQSHAKADALFKAARSALVMPKNSRRRSKSARAPQPRFVKKLLWGGSGDLAMDRLAVSARLWAHALNVICR